MIAHQRSLYKRHYIMLVCVCAHVYMSRSSVSSSSCVLYTVLSGSIVATSAVGEYACVVCSLI